MEKVTITIYYKFCQKSKNENRLRMSIRTERRIGLYEKCCFMGTDIFITGNCSFKKLMLSLSISSKVLANLKLKGC